MYPQTVVLSLILIMSLTVIQYFLFTPSGIQNNNNNNNNNNFEFEGYWSPMTGDFDWCEYNYLLTKYIAEPWNTFTSIIYCIVSIISIYFISIYIPSSIYTKDIKFCAFLLCLIGIGSTLFHATLLYKHQLCDEMPMQWLVCYASVMFYTRNDYKLYIIDSSHPSSSTIKNNNNKSSRNFYLNIINTIFVGSIAIILWSTPKQSTIHQIMRIPFGISFVVGFVYLFYVGAKCGNQVYEFKPNDINYTKINTFYDNCFISFTIALIGWLCDNLYCEMLQNLYISGFKIPYLHFHAILWHCGTCIGLHYMFLVILAHRIVFQYKKDIKCTKICFGLLPYVKVQQKSN